MKQTLLAVLLGLTAVGLVIFSLSPASRADDNGVSLGFNADDNGQVITAGQTIHFTAILTNTDAVTRTYIFAAQVPTGTVFVASSPNLQANSYPVGVSAADPVKSLTWSGTISPAVSRLFTFTLQIDSAGIGPGGDIAVNALVFDAGGGAELSRQTITLDWPGATLYFPLIARNSGPPTPQPTSTPSPTPTPLPATGQFTPTVAGGLQSQATDYNVALAGGGYVQGQDLLYDTTPDHYWALNLTLVQCNFMELVYMVHRDYLEYDTSGVGSFGHAYLVFRNNMAYPGPPAHSVNIYQGTWTQLITETNQVRPENWAAYGALIATAPGNTQPAAVTATVTIPAAYINPGGVTRFALKTSTEGAAPPLNSCFGGPNPGLGASLSLPYLYLVP
ncbi:MAG: hypothetical protein FOGNACKC_05506 [Anaerolineae bacterium]|nr:hypothetical protein [Anaerolineae bacterium]